MGDGLAGLLGNIDVGRLQSGYQGLLQQGLLQQQVAMMGLPQGVIQRQYLPDRDAWAYTQGTAGASQTIIIDALTMRALTGTGVAPKAPHSDLAWLDKRVDEIRVKL